MTFYVTYEQANNLEFLSQPNEMYTLAYRAY
jgi:hypothetical protein